MQKSHKFPLSTSGSINNVHLTATECNCRKWRYAKLGHYPIASRVFSVRCYHCAMALAKIVGSSGTGVEGRYQLPKASIVVLRGRIEGP